MALPHDMQYELISQQIENPINLGNKKMMIFTAFSDTAEYCMTMSAGT